MRKKIEKKNLFFHTWTYSKYKSFSVEFILAYFLFILTYTSLVIFLRFDNETKK